MNTDIEIPSVVVDGQRTILPTFAQIESLLSEGQFEGLRFGSPFMNTIISSLVASVAKYPEMLVMGFCQPHAFPKSWLPQVLLRHADGLRRVLLEIIACQHCGWRGCIANPADTSLFLG